MSAMRFTSSRVLGFSGSQLLRLSSSGAFAPEPLSLSSCQPLNPSGPSNSQPILDIAPKNVKARSRHVEDSAQANGDSVVAKVSRDVIPNNFPGFIS